MKIVYYDDLLNILEIILLKHGFEKADAHMCAEIFAENSLCGVLSHGVFRFPSFIDMITRGYIDPVAKPTREKSFSALEQWNGNLGPGPLNANIVTSEVIKLSQKYGIGCIALRNSNHWMRPGYYAWKAADQGIIFICWSNTIPIMPPWGAIESTVGNNPIVFGVPGKEGNIVLDMALSQYSYGKLATYAFEGRDLPYPGGYDREGNLTKNAKEIYKAQRPLPIGYWKGSGLALLLDLIATILAGGHSTFDLSKENEDSGMSQVFIAIDPNKFSSSEIIEKAVKEILDYYLSAEKLEEGELSYPGERIIKNREKNLRNGIHIIDRIWDKIELLRNA
jgi:3-dehydro-L-gulonate 2-dehydrogenase